MAGVILKTDPANADALGQSLVKTYGMAKVLVTGEIKKGDYIAISTDGVGKKATEEGVVLGFVTKDPVIIDEQTSGVNNSTRLVDVFINTTYYNPNFTDTATPDQIIFSDTLLNTLKLSTFESQNTIAAYSNFNVTGSLTAKKLTSVEDITVGLTVINGTDNSINTIAGEPLKLQNKPYSGDLEIFNGKVLFTTNGNLVTVGEVTASKINTQKISILGTDSTSILNSSKILIGETKTTVKNDSVNENSKIFITPRSKLNNQTIIVTKIVKGEFEVEIEQPLNIDVLFDYFVVDKDTNESN